MRLATLKDVASVAGVHPATASRALNPETREMVSADTVKRVQRAAESLGYRPNPLARGLKTARTTTLGVVIPDLTNPIFPPLVRGIESALEPAGYTALTINTDADLELERGRVESLRARQVEGMIIATGMRHHPLMVELREQGMPIVLVNRRVDGLEVPSVVGDDERGMHEVVAHLIALGHKRIAHLPGPSDTSTGLVRERAFNAALREAGIPEDPSLTVRCDRWNVEDGAEATRRLLASGAEFTAVVGGNDLIALGCHDVLSAAGWSCPGDVSVTGFNDMPFLDRLSPGLTTVRVPHFDIGAEAARLFLECLGQPSRVPRSIVLPVSLVVRASTAPPNPRRRRRPS